MRVAFFNSDGLRSGWRVATFVLLIALSHALFLLMSFLALGDSIPEGEDARLVMVTGLNVLPALLVTWACARWIDGRSVRDGVFAGRWQTVLNEVLFGAAVGLAIILMTLLTLSFLADVHIRWHRPSPVLFTLWLLFFLAAASWEEVLFRGYAFVWLCRGLGRFFATAVVAVVFCLAHGLNPNVTVLSVVTIGVASVLLCLASIACGGRLWLPIGLHWGWNVSQAMVFGGPVSGLSAAEVPRLTTVEASGAELLTGGDFGLEGSLLLLMWACGAALAGAWLLRRDAIPSRL